MSASGPSGPLVYLGEIANTNYKSNKELDSFSSFNIK